MPTTTYAVTLIKNATAAFEQEGLHAAHEVNGPRFAHAILTTGELFGPTAYNQRRLIIVCSGAPSEPAAAGCRSLAALNSPLARAVGEVDTCLALLLLDDSNPLELKSS
jgi:hypothetical protein